MKKTIIAMLALSGVAFGADPVLDFNFENMFTIPEGFTYSGESIPSYSASGLEGYGNAIEFNKADYFKADSGYDFVTVGANGSDFSMVTTVRFDNWAELTPNATIENRLYICGSGSTNEQGIGWTVANGTLGITTKKVAHNPIDQTTPLTLNTWYTLALTYDAETGAAEFYVDGTKVGSLTLNTATVHAPNGSFAIGSGRSDGNLQAVWDGAMADFKLYNTTLTAEEVAAFGAPTPATPAIPEPTTATLSLLALAGLAARRRRK